MGVAADGFAWVEVGEAGGRRRRRGGRRPGSDLQDQQVVGQQANRVRHGERGEAFDAGAGPTFVAAPIGLAVRVTTCPDAWLALQVPAVGPHSKIPPGLPLTKPLPVTLTMSGKVVLPDPLTTVTSPADTGTSLSPMALVLP